MLQGTVKSSTLSPLIIFAEETLGVTLLQKHLPYLKSLGYQALCSTYVTDLVKNQNFTFHALEVEQAEISQISQWAAQYQGGLITLLDHQYMHVLKNSDPHCIIYTLSTPTGDTTLSLAQQMQGMSLSFQIHSISPKSGLDFKKPIRAYLEHSPHSYAYTHETQPQIHVKLQRILPQIKIYKVNEKQSDAVCPVDNIFDFEEKAAKIYNVFALSSTYQHDAKKLVISDVLHYEKQKNIHQYQPGIPLDSKDLSTLQSFLKNWEVLPEQETSSFEKGLRKISFTLPKDIEIDNKYKIQKLTLYCHYKNPKHSDNYEKIEFEWSFARLLCKMTNGTMKIFRGKSEHCAKNLNSFLLTHRAHLENVFIERSPVKDWSKVTTLTAYGSEAKCFYEGLHKKIASELVTMLHQNAALFHSAQESGMQIFSFGCGDGKELTQALSKLSQENIQATGIGIDINAANFPKKAPSGIQLIEGKMQDLEKLISPYLNNKNLKVGFFTGSLTNQCITGTVEAIQILHQAKALNIVFLSGYTGLLIAPAMAKAAGWNIDKKETLDEDHHTLNTDSFFDKVPLLHNVYQLSKMDMHARKYYLIQRAKSRSTQHQLDNLDLSLSSDPLYDLSLFDDEHLDAITKIDLSWSAMNLSEFVQFFTYMDSLGKNKFRIILSGVEPWLAYFQYVTLKTQFEFIERTDFNPNEVNAFSPEEARLLRLYKNQPYKPCTKVQQHVPSQVHFDALQKNLDLLALKPHNSTTPFKVKDALIFSSVKFPYKNNSSIKSMRMIMANSEYQTVGIYAAPIPCPSKSLLWVNTLEGKKIYTFPTEQAFNKVLMDLSSIGYQEKMRAPTYQEHIQNIPWKGILTKNLYQKTPGNEKFYNNLNEYIPSQVFKALLKNPIFTQQATQHGVSIFSFGCGEGKELFSTQNFLKTQHIVCNATVGIDINPANFKPFINKGVIFKEGDITKLDQKIITQYSSKTGVNIGLFMGSLVPQCITGLREALYVLHQVKDLDIILLSGFQTPLILKWAAKGMGWNFSGHPVDINMKETISNLEADIYQVYTLSKMSNTQRKDYLIQRGTRRTRANQFHCLDLSMSADPLKDMRLFTLEELKDIKQIDLSWTSMSKQMLTEVHTILCKLPHCKTIIISDTEKWRHEKNIFKGYNFFVREDYPQNEIPAFPVHKARKLGLFDDLPGKRLKTF